MIFFIYIRMLSLVLLLSLLIISCSSIRSGSTVPGVIAVTGGGLCAGLASSANIETVIVTAGTCTFLAYLYGKKLDEKRQWALATIQQIEEEIEFYRERNQQLLQYNKDLAHILKTKLDDRKQRYRKNRQIGEEIEAIDKTLDQERRIANKELKAVNKLLFKIDTIHKALSEREQTFKIRGQLKVLEEQRRSFYKTKKILYDITQI